VLLDSSAVASMPANAILLLIIIFLCSQHYA
jgi:hypothetical protein